VSDDPKYHANRRNRLLHSLRERVFSMYERQSHDWAGSQCRISLLSARSYIFTFQRRCTTGGRAAAARRRPVLYGCRARAGYRSANMARCAQLLQGAVFTWVRVLPVRVRRRRLLSRYANIRISLNEHMQYRT